MAAGMAATLACAHGVTHYHLRTGPYARARLCWWMDLNTKPWARLGSNCAIFDPADMLEMNFYADTYGIDTISLGNSIAFAMECYEYGILNKERTGGLDLTWGNADCSARTGPPNGARRRIWHDRRAGRASDEEDLRSSNLAPIPSFMQDIGMEVKGLEISEYMTKESLAQQGGYAMASKGAQHDEAWLIFMELVHKQLPTFEAKAEALHYFPIWRTWFSLHGLCKLPWNDIIPVSNKTAQRAAKVPEHVENYTWLYEGVTGEKVTIDDFMLQSERVYQFQRIFNLRLGYGTRASDYPPYRAVGPVTDKEYESRAERYDNQLRDEVGIDPDGLSTG